MSKKLREAYSFNSINGDKSFDELYKDYDELFENTDDIIDPRVKKLFESVYSTKESDNTKQLDKIQECGDWDFDFAGEDDSKPSGDGVPASHNKPGLSGSDPATEQSDEKSGSNSFLFESVYKLRSKNPKKVA